MNATRRITVPLEIVLELSVSTQVTEVEEEQPEEPENK